jgi:hypothetical protein
VETELERREARLVAARKTLAELSRGSAGLELLAEIEQAHAAVEAAERRMVSARIPSMAVRARQRLRNAREAEQQILAAHGYDSWLGLQLRRVDALFAQPSSEDVMAAEEEHRAALASWKELAGETDLPTESAPLRPARRNVALRPDAARPAVA